MYILIMSVLTCRAHKTTRAVVERGIGQLKRCFRVLHGEVRLTPDKVCKVIIACAILHNICKARQIAAPLEGDGDEDSNDDDGGEENINFPQGNMAQSGLPYRARFTNLCFRQVTVYVIWKAQFSVDITPPVGVELNFFCCLKTSIVNSNLLSCRDDVGAAGAAGVAGTNGVWASAAAAAGRLNVSGSAPQHCCTPAMLRGPVPLMAPCYRKGNTLRLIIVLF